MSGGFDPNKKAKVIAEQAATPVVVDTREVQKTPTSFQRTPALRLANAQRSCREHRSESPNAIDLFQGEEYYTDFAGADTSEHWWDALHAIVGLIHVPKHFTMGMVGYDRKTGEGKAVDGLKKIRVPIAELKAAVSARIAELGLSEALIWEYLVECHTVAEDSAFFGTPFETRIARFKEQATE
jgi:hypothetical protein